MRKNVLSEILKFIDYDHKDIVEILISGGAYVNLTDKRDKIPLVFAAINGHFEVVKLLIVNGAHIDALQSRPGTALIAAAWK